MHKLIYLLLLLGMPQTSFALTQVCDRLSLTDFSQSPQPSTKQIRNRAALLYRETDTILRATIKRHIPPVVPAAKPIPPREKPAHNNIVYVEPPKEFEVPDYLKSLETVVSIKEVLKGDGVVGDATVRQRCAYGCSSTDLDLGDEWILLMQNGEFVPYPCSESVNLSSGAHTEIASKLLTALRVEKVRDQRRKPSSSAR